MDAPKFMNVPPKRQLSVGITETHLLTARAARERLTRWVLAACTCGAIAVAAQPVPGNSRGELLYTTHCTGCHTAQVHWRDKKLATDWAGLRKQVTRWETNTGLAWSDQDIVAVTRYLNTLYYRFPAPDSPVALQPVTRID